MPREVGAKLYDAEGNYICTRIDRCQVIDRRDGQVHTMQQPAKPTPKPFSIR